MIGLNDMGFFRKKNEAINNNGDFKNTLGNCKHYGAKFLDCLGIAAGTLFIIPLIINVFNRDDNSGNNNNNNNNNNGRARRR